MTPKALYAVREHVAVYIFLHAMPYYAMPITHLRKAVIGVQFIRHDTGAFRDELLNYGEQVLLGCIPNHKR
ncbi:MAG: hypothetical protein SOW56_08460, partial [Bacteroidaceae bacterium]|nr:hypothetical protein [Bacteroidaceae bacterium]